MTHILVRNWSRKAVIYQIYPRSFKDSNDDGIGDLEGIIQKLDYLNGKPDSLGIDAIWLSPIYPSPMADFGYDISDYCNIDPIFGDLTVFDRFVSEAHKRNIKVIMDFVANHTSSQHPWFLQSRSSRDNPKRDWYIWKDPKPDGSPPNNWISVFGGSAWEWDAHTQQYYLHSFLAQQSDLNWRNKEVRTAMDEVLEFWLDRKVDGFRSDAIFYLIKDKQFRDDPINPNYKKGVDDPYNALIHLYSQGRSETFETINEFCEILGHYKDKFMVSEVYLGDIPDMLKFYTACTDRLESPINFILMSLPWEAQAYRSFIDKFDKALGKDSWPNYVVGNHDRPRIATRRGKKKTRLIAMLLLTLRGLPFIYNGDEIGMENNDDIPAENVQDPSGKGLERAELGRDGERTPIQWDDNTYSGFSHVEPWLPVNKNYTTINVAQESQDPTSLLSLYKKLIHYRKQSSALLEGTYASIDMGSLPVFTYIRQSTKETLLVILNFSDQEQSFQIPLQPGLSSQEGKLFCNTLLDISPDSIIHLNSLTLRPYEGYILTL